MASPELVAARGGDTLMLIKVPVVHMMGCDAAVAYYSKASKPV